YIINKALRDGLRVSFKPSQTGWTGTLFNPVWGETEWPLTTLEVWEDKIVFCIAQDQDRIGTFTGRVVDGGIRGIYEWKSTKYDFVLGRGPAKEVDKGR